MPPLTEENYTNLCEAARLFGCQQDYSLHEVDKVMEKVSGPYNSEGQRSEEGTDWAKYWSNAVAVTELDAEIPMPKIPGPPTYLAVVPFTSTAWVSSPMPTLVPSTPIDLGPTVAKNFNAACVDVKEEHERRRLNSNIPKREKKNTGAWQDVLLNQLVIVHNQADKKRDLYCIGCLGIWASIAADRAFPHAQSCSAMQQDFHSTWNDAMKRLGSKSVASAEDEDHKQAPVAEELCQGKITEAFEPAQLTPQQWLKINFFLLRLLLCCALAWALLDDGFFIDFVNALNLAYKVPNQSNFIVFQLTSEVQEVAGKIVEYLTQFIHLMLSFDGWSSCGFGEIYTVHITMHDIWQSYFIEGLLLTGCSCTGERIAGKLGKVILTYTALRFSLVMSDSANNVRSACCILCSKWPWIMSSPSPCHILNLLAKDLILGSKKYPKVRGFSDVLSVVSAFTTYFPHSNHSKFHLRKEMKKEKDKQGIEKGRETHFSTYSTHTKSLQCCWPAIAHCHSAHVLKFEGKGSQVIRSHLEDFNHGMAFVSDLRTTIRILNLIETGLHTLKGLNTTLSDVLNVFIGVAVAFT
ncbi:hypothetical protein AAF712_015395 [Marasmius tenuissimus]|uniref:DUF659 domain-containing protein n=1 Tax=Marasmius tenuissimus TaxID=585030 RepID=A0ABR2Z8D5_9AGAR